MCIILQFPSRAVRRFTQPMRAALDQLAACTPGAAPVMFLENPDGSETCLLGAGLQIDWDRAGRLVLTDTVSGFVDRGPFGDLDDVCLLVSYLAA